MSPFLNLLLLYLVKFEHSTVQLCRLAVKLITSKIIQSFINSKYLPRILGCHSYVHAEIADKF